MPSLWKKLQDWLALAVCLVVSFGVLVGKNQPVMTGLRGTALEASSWVEARFAWAGRFMGALGENDRLREDNIALSAQVARSRAALQENDRLRQMLGLRDTVELPMHLTRIVGKDIGQQQNHFTIDAGRRDSVKVGMPVVDERGILGKIVLVSEHYSRVMAYLNTDFRVSVRLLPLGAEGIVRWDGTRPDRLTLDYISRTDPVRPGMTAVTSGYSDAFPQGLPVGVVREVEAREGRNQLDILLEPTSLLNRARFGFVILRVPDPEVRDVESE